MRIEKHRQSQHDQPRRAAILLPLGHAVRRTLTAALLLLAIGPATRPSAVAAQERPGGFRVVVNESNKLDSIPVDRLSKIFLKKVSRWESGAPIEVVDQEKHAAVRQVFSSAVLHRSLNAVLAYWQQQIFSGHTVPPRERIGDAAILDFVRSHPDAIGYVSAGVDPGPGVKVVKITS